MEMEKSDQGKSLGKFGEILAERFLKDRGYAIRERNFRCPLGEIDLVAEEGGELVFVEVKSRRGGGFGFPEEQISWKKQRKLERLAAYYLKRYRHDVPVRIDVVAILLGPEKEILSITLYPAVSFSR